MYKTLDDQMNINLMYNIMNYQIHSIQLKNFFLFTTIINLIINTFILQKNDLINNNPK